MHVVIVTYNLITPPSIWTSHGQEFDNSIIVLHVWLTGHDVWDRGVLFANHHRKKAPW